MKVLQEILVPLLSVNDQTLTIQELSFKTGDAVKAGEVVALLETSKTTYTVEADANGFIEYFCSAGDDLPVNDVMAKIYDVKPELILAPINGKYNNKEEIGDEKKSLKKIEQTIFSNEALKLISQFNVDKGEFTGYDLVNGEDVRSKAEPGYKQRKKNEVKKISDAGSVADEVDQEKVNIVKLSSNKLREIDYLNNVQSSGLISVININVECEEVLPFLQVHMHYFKDSLLPVIVYESSRLLRKYPVFNAYYSDKSILFHKNVNVGFAVDIDKGLKVVKISNTEKKSIREIEDEIIRLSGNYIDDKLLLEDLTDVTFTITDLSMENVAFFHPLINAKNSAILGISAVDKKLSRCTLSLAFDHRITEGKQAAIFLSELKQRIESFHSRGDLQEIKKRQAALISCHRCMKTLAEDSSNVGFVQSITADGKQGYICQACFKGF